jgi:hypothetical protein
MWVRFTSDYPFSPDAMKGRVTIAYKAGMVMNATRECADKAIAVGKAEPARKAEADGDGE